MPEFVFELLRIELNFSVHYCNRKEVDTLKKGRHTVFFLAMKKYLCKLELGDCGDLFNKKK